MRPPKNIELVQGQGGDNKIILICTGEAHNVDVLYMGAENFEKFPNPFLYVHKSSFFPASNDFRPGIIFFCSIIFFRSSIPNNTSTEFFL